MMARKRIRISIYKVDCGHSVFTAPDNPEMLGRKVKLAGDRAGQVVTIDRIYRYQGKTSCFACVSFDMNHEHL